MCISKSIVELVLFRNLQNVCTQKCMYAACPRGMKVTICGAAGASGQPLSLLLKESQVIDQLALYDLVKVSDFGLALNQVDTKCKVTTYTGRQCLCDALRGSNIVLLMCKSPCDTLAHNSAVIADLTMQICTHCPSAFTLVATQPVDILLPIVANIQKLRGVYNPRTLVGCVEWLRIRASGILAEYLMTCGDDAGVIKVSSEHIQLPYVGGATACTMVPLLSLAKYPGKPLNRTKTEDVTARIMDCNSKPAPTTNLAGAFSLARIVTNVVRGMQGDKNITQLAFMDHMGFATKECQFMSTQVLLGPSGVERNFGLPKLSEFEACVLRSVIPYIQTSHYKANQFVYSLWRSSTYPAREPVAEGSNNYPPPDCWNCHMHSRDDHMRTVS